MSKFTGRIDPMNYLIKETVIHGDKQLSLIEDINDKLMIKDCPRPFLNEPKSQNFAVNWEMKELKSRNFENAPNKISRSKSSHALKKDSEENQECSPTISPPQLKKARTGKEKREGFKTKKSMKTMQIEEASSAKLDLNQFDENNLDTHFEQRREKSPQNKDLPLLRENSSKIMKSKSFKNKRLEHSKTVKISDSHSSSSKNISLGKGEKKLPLRHSGSNIKTKQKFSRKYGTCKILLMESTITNKKRRVYRTNCVGGTQDNSPCNVSKNMKRFNNETFRSKKFMQGIDEDVYKSNYVIVDKKQLEVRCKAAVLNSTSQKENTPTAPKSAYMVEKRKPPKGKHKLKRGMTVKFQMDEDILCQVEKNKNLVRKFCQTKSFKKKLSRTRITSENNRGKSKDKYKLKQMKKPKYSIDFSKRGKSKSYAADQYFSET